MIGFNPNYDFLTTPLGWNKSSIHIVDGKLGEHAVFIGARKDDDSWSWLDGSSWDYTNWGQNQPDGGPTDNCIQIGKPT